MFAWEAPYKNLALHPGVGQSLSEKKSPAECIFNQNANRWLGRLTDGKSNWLKWPEAKKSGAMRSATYFKLSTFQKFKNFNRLFLDEKNGNGTDAILLLWLQALIFVILEKWNWIKKV